MLEKIGLPAKPSLRGNNWVIDATHCQGCSSQFTFINRKHHCRRCGGLFCGSCTQQRMYLRGQGDSPVRICEPCKTLEEAARFEMRHGYKNKSKRGASKLTSDDEDEVLTKVLTDNGNGSVSSNKDPSIQRATSASCSNSGMDIDIDSITPEELRQRAVEEKKKYKALKASGKPAEALRAFKRGKELERQAGTLEIELRKNRKKTVSSSMINENVKIKKPKEKDDLASELKELGWSDRDLRDADKKPVSMTLEGELSTLLKEVSQKTEKTEKTEKGSFGIARSEVVAIKKNALALKRDGKLTEAKEELKRAKILEKQIEERELLGDDEDSDDEFTSLIRGMDIDKNDVLAARNDWNNRDFDFDRLLRVDEGLDEGPDGPGNFEVTDEDMDDPEMSAALQSFGWTEDHDVNKESLKRKTLNKKHSDNTNNDAMGASLKLAPKSKLVIQRELLVLKKNALALRRQGKVDEAEQELAKGKALEKQLEELENGPKVKPHFDFSDPMAVEDGEEDVTDTDMNDPSYLSILQNLGWKDEDKGEHVGPKMKTVESTKSKSEIQRELLGLKRKSLALRREGNADEAEEVLKTAKGLEAQLAEMEAPKQEIEKKDEKTGPDEKPVVEKAQVGVNEPGSVQEQVLAHKRKAVSLKREGRLAEAKEELKLAKLLENTNTDTNTNTNTSTNTDTNTNMEENVSVSEAADVIKKDKTNNSPPKLSSRDRFKLQQQSLSHKRQALKLRREGRVEEAEAEFELAKNLESQLEALTATNESEKPAGDVGVEDLLDPQLLFALREVGIEGVGARSSPEKMEPVNAKSAVNKIPGEAVKAKPTVNKIPAETVVKTTKNDRTDLEDEIKAEKVKALNLKRAGKQAEALDALRRAKLLEKRLNSLP